MLHWKKVLRLSIFSLLCMLALGSEAQSRIDIGVQVSPQLRYVTSTPSDEPSTADDITYGGSGLALGYGFGGYLEYELLSDVFVRAGVDVVRRRYDYSVERRTPEGSVTTVSSRRVTINALEIPLALVYHLRGETEERGLVIGVGGVLNRWIGGTDVQSDLSRQRSAGGGLRIASQSINAFIGYEHHLNELFLLSWEPYAAYTPTTFSYESHTTSQAPLEVGITVRLLFDN